MIMIIIKHLLLNQISALNNPLEVDVSLSYLPTPPLGQDMTQGQFLSGV